MPLRLALILLFAGVSLASARPALFKDARQAMAIARAQGRTEITLVLLANPGRTPAVEEKARALGGSVRFKAADVDYLRIRIPINRANELAEFNQVAAATVDFDDSFPFRLTDSPASEPKDAWPPKTTDYPLQHPYSPLADLDAEQLRDEHPTWDGRGVTIAVLDGNFDMLLPEFQTAYSLEGKAIPKVADYLTVTDPRDDFNQTPQWVDMHAVVRSKSGHISFQGKDFTVPKDGDYHIGFFSERRFDSAHNGAYIKQDIDRDGNPPADDGLFGVLWNKESNDVWVDTNRNLSFRDETALTDYAQRPQFGVFGKDNRDTPIRESIGFAVQTDRQHDFVAVDVGFYQHSTEIMGTVVGNRQPHGRLEGIAPGARMVSIYWGASIHGMAEGLITAFRHPKVDLIVLEQSVNLLSLSYGLSDGRHPISVLIQRLIDKYNKLVFVPGANAPAFAFVAEDGAAPGAVSVGGYQSAESYRLNTGLVLETHDNLHFGALSHGPNTAGALKPDLLAPSGQVSTDPGYRGGQSLPGLFQLPPGYAIGAGTSTATPMAAGAAALVVSAAKQSGIRYDAVTLKAALTDSARHIENLPVNAQGSGLLQVSRAIERLRQLQAGHPMEISVQAPVINKLSGELAKPDVGVGLYEREGWALGRRAERTIALRRTSGPRSPVTFTLTWQGNDGTFSTPANIALPLNETVSLPLAVDARSEGAHSAILSLTSAIGPGTTRRVLNTIVVPYQLTQANGYSARVDVVPPVATDASVFVNVPAGVSALSVSASVPGFRLSLIAPDRSTQWESGCGWVEDSQPPTCSVSRPMAGVWEINVFSLAARKFNPDAPIPFKPTAVAITASAVDVGVSVSGEGTVSFLNRLGKVNAQAASVPLGSAFEAHPTIAQGEQQTFLIDVPKGTARLHARIGNPGDSRADLDLYLLDCSQPDQPPAEAHPVDGSPLAPAPLCSVRAKNDETGATGDIEIPNPHPGHWIAVVDAYRVPAGRTTYDYWDLFTHPRFGTLAVTDSVGEHASGQSWAAQLHPWVAQRPEPPRKLWAYLPVTSAEVTQGIRVKDGYDLSGIASWSVPIGQIDRPQE